MGLQELLITNKPRESSGSSSSNRFDYQKNWALCKLFDLHKSKADYVMVFDYHDDIIVLDSDSTPQTIDFYQIKTKDKGNWSVTDLLRRKQGKDNTQLLSIFGKLYNNKILFPLQTASLNFISNAKYNIKLKDVNVSSLNKNMICLTDISSDELSKINKQLISEHALTQSPTFEGITYLYVSDQNINGHDIYAKGKLSDFLEDLNPNGKYQVGAVYRALFDEVRRKNNYEWDLNNLEDVIRHKAISRSHFNSMIDGLGVKQDLDSLWQSVEQRLNFEKTPFSSINKLRRKWQTYEAERINQGNLLIQQIRKDIIALLKEFNSVVNLSDLMNEVLSEYSQVQHTPNIVYDDDYIRAIILMEYMTNE